MFVLSRFVFVVIVTGCIASSSSISAQSPDTVQNRGATISMTGTHDTLLAPDKLRLLMLAKAESRDAKRAYQSLIEHQKRVAEELKKEGALSTSIEFTKPVISVGVPGVDDPEAAKKRAKQQAALTRNMNLRGRQQNEEIDDDNELPLVYTASCRVLAEWKLDPAEEETTLLLPTKIKGAIDQYDWKGKSMRVVLNEDEQKLISPLLGSSSIYSSERTVPEVLLFYVGRSTDQQDEEATKEAIKKAQYQATVLAKGMGKKISGIRSASISPLQSTLLTRSLEYGSNGQVIMSMVRKDPRESIHEDSNFLKQTFSVSLQFELE